MKPEDPSSNLDLRYRTLLILWFAISMSVFLFLVFTCLSPVEPVENRSLTLALNSLGLVPVALSFLLKQKLLNRSVESQQVDLVQKAYVLSFALCESAALLGLLNHFLTGSSYYYFAFAIAGLGMLLHFPQKKHLLAASYKQF